MRRDEHPIRRRNPSGEEVWIARYTASDGKRRSAGTFKRRGPCKQPAEDGECCARHAILRAYEADRPRRADLPTVGSYFADWLDRHPRAERTSEGYHGRVRCVLDVPVQDVPFRDWPLCELKRAHIGRLVDVMLRDHGRAASGTRGVVSVLSAMFENAIDDGVIDTNPALGVRVRNSDPRVQKPKRTITVATWAQMYAFARAAGEYEPMVRVLSDCGLRLGEMLALECKHIRGDVLVIEQSAWHSKIRPGTKQTDRREAPISPGLQALLAPVARDRIGLLFPAPTGRPWQERTFYRVVWYPAQEKSGLMLRPHDLRHSWVSELRSAGINPVDLALVAGHTVGTATRIYTHGMGRSHGAIREAVGG